MNYPNDSNILGIEIDKFLQNKSRKELCRYMDAVLPEKGFFELDSTTKIRLGCQLLKNYNKIKGEQINEDQNDCVHNAPKSDPIRCKCS